MSDPTPAPALSEVSHLKPRDATGALYTLLCLTLTGGGVALTQLGWGAWALGQVVLAVALLQWFVLLHECGHGVLFRRRALNRVVGHLAGFFCTIPFRSWAPIHSLHHKWTGWQDLDPTTTSLVPRSLGEGERRLMNVCWRYWIPSFTVIYRVANFWNLPRLRRILTRRGAVRGVAINAAVLLLAYALVAWAVGPLALLLAIGPAMLLSLILIEPIMMSQHTHIPLRNSEGQPVKPFGAANQQPFTRSLRFPGWFSKAVLLHFDAHELHHMYPAVPGYCLREISYTPANEVHWWRWISQARRLPAEVFLFQNRDESGSTV